MTIVRRLPGPRAPNLRRGGRVAEGARLESVYTGNRIGGSNPPLSARYTELNALVVFAQPPDYARIGEVSKYNLLSSPVLGGA